MCLEVDQSRSRDWQAMGLSPPHTARGRKAGPSEPLGLRDTDLERFLGNTVLHTL